jgi:hypothetical protein
MDLLVFIVLGAMVVAVAVDDVRRRPPRDQPDPTITTTQKMVVDLSKR